MKNSSEDTSDTEPRLDKLGVWLRLVKSILRDEDGWWVGVVDDIGVANTFISD